jgi:hypothetical protein
MRSLSAEIEMLGQYNAEVCRGIVHTEAWKQKMAELRRRINMDTYGNPEGVPDGRLIVVNCGPDRGPIGRFIDWVLGY